MKWKLLNVSEFSTIKSDWDKLNNSSLNQVILEADFIEHCVDKFCNGQELIVHGSDEQGVVAICILVKKSAFIWQTFQPSQAPLGLFLTRNGQLANTLLDGIAKTLPGPVAFIDLLQQDATLLNYSDVQNHIEQPYIETGRLDLPYDYDDYFASLSKNTRQNYNKVYNRAKKAEQVLSCKRIDSADDIDQALALYCQFETSGWKGKSGTAVSMDNSQGLFYKAMLTQYAHKNQAEIWHFCVNGEIVATDLCILHNDTLVILKTAYNEVFKAYSPALCLKYEIIKYHSHKKKIKRIEFFGKAMDWHKKLGSDIRPIEHVTWFPLTLTKRAYTLIKKAG